MKLIMQPVKPIKRIVICLIKKNNKWLHSFFKQKFQFCLLFICYLFICLHMVRLTILNDSNMDKYLLL